MAIKDGNIRPAATMSKEEHDKLLKAAKDFGYKNVGKYLLASARINYRLDISDDLKKELSKPLV